jgi:tRNA (cmo5U34)-methyltransferase
MKQWTFKSKKIASIFDSHVNAHLPWYSLATDLIVCIAENYAEEDGRIYDVGASTGNVTRSIQHVIEQRNIDAVSIECSQQMVDKFKGVGEIVCADARFFDFEKYDISFCFLTLMFNSIEDRSKILQRLIESKKEGGALVIVEKFEVEESGYAATTQRRMTMRLKQGAGVSCDEIVSKELSLSGVQRPLRFSEIKQYNPIEFFRVGEFRGFIL